MPQAAFPIIELIFDIIGCAADAAGERKHGCAVVLVIFTIIAAVAVAVAFL